jgi:hypothetical protein
MKLIQGHEYSAEFAAGERATQAEAHRLWLEGDFSGAVEAAEAACRYLLDRQPDGRRFHKGWSLHQLGLYLLFLNNGPGALEATFLAFAEDAMSLAEEQHDRLLELGRPAAHNLVYVFGIPGPPIADCARMIRTLIEQGELFADPHDLLRVRPVAKLLDLAPAKTGRRIPGLFMSRPEDRVWIGGSYKNGRLDGVLRAVRNHVDGLGFDGVIAADFSIPVQMGVDEHAIHLMTSCRRAFFDITLSGGETDEIAELADTLRTRTLAVYDATVEGAPNVSKGMTLEKLHRWGIEPVPFADMDELLSLITTWLQKDSVT